MRVTVVLAFGVDYSAAGANSPFAGFEIFGGDGDSMLLLGVNVESRVAQIFAPTMALIFFLIHHISALGATFALLCHFFIHLN